MKYQLKVYYRTDATRKVSEWMREIVQEWKESKKELEICRTFEFSTPEPLTQEVKDRLVALREDWMEKVELVEVE